MIPTFGSSAARRTASAIVVSTILVAASSALLPAPASAASPALSLRASTQDANKDVINLKSGQTELGKIKSEDFGGIDIDPAKGEAKRIPWSDVAPNGVTYAAPEWQAVADVIAAGKFADALPLLTELKGEAKLRLPIKQNVLYFLGVSLQREGKADEALAAYKELVAAFPKSRYLLEVGDAMVTILAAKKDFAGATKALQDLDSAAGDASFSSAAGVLKGRVFEEQKDWAKASAAYSVAAKASGVSPIVQMQAELGEARTLAAQNKKSEAESALRKLVAKDGPNHLLAGAWNGLGDLAQERARAANNGKGDADQLLDALYMYLRGVVQYAPLPGQPTREYERAIAGSAAIFTALSQVETVADRKRLYQQRAAQRLEQLRREFPNSPFATSK
ncbi:MAG: tetratricopeptide repeat protein [Planctomycetota bacterium]|nr:tetratricopeptide repeat protein [Planctomycetota bacterium]